MKNEVIEFLKITALNLKDDFTIYDSLYGEIILNDTKEKLGEASKVHLSSGSVYGIFAIKQNHSNINKLFDEVGNNIKSIDKDNKIYPIYWGKDINPGSRIVSHARPSKSGNAKLEKIKELRSFTLIYGCIFISDYEKFEAYLYDNNPPLIGTKRVGKQSKYTVIVN